MSTITTEQPAKASRSGRIKTLAGAIHTNCNCLLCRVHAAELRRDIFAQKAAGTWQPYVDTAAALAHVEMLHAQGMSYAHIARLARVDINAIHRMRGKYAALPASKQIRTESANRILALKAQFTRQAPDARIPNRGALRRIQALRAIGWPVNVLMEKSGLSNATFTDMPRRAWVKTSTQRAVESLYELLYDQNPAEHGVDPWIVHRGKRYAAKRRWAVPLAWTDIDTDENPNRTISRMGYQAASAKRTHAEVVEETEYLAGFGLSRDQVAERMDLQWASVVAAHRRAGVEVPLRLRMENASEGAGPNRAGDP